MMTTRRWTSDKKLFNCSICGHPADTFAPGRNGKFRSISVCIHCGKPVCFRCYLPDFNGDLTGKDPRKVVHTTGSCEAMQWLNS